jgi:hypothetical protein
VETWVLQMCRRSGIRQLAAWGLALAAALMLAALNARYLTNFASGPFPIGAAELERLGNPAEAPQYFARVSGSRTVDTGIQQITVEKRGGSEVGRSVSAVYYALEVGDRFLIVKSPSGQPTVVEGELAPMPADLDQNLFDTPEMRATRHRFYPFYMDATSSFRFPGYCAIAAGLVFILLLWRKALPAWRRLHDPSSHPVVARVASWGDPIGLAVAIEREYRGRPFLRSGAWTLTDRYLIRASFFAFDVLRFSDLLWAYKRVTKKSVNFVPTGTDYNGILVCYGGSATVGGSEEQVNKTLQHAAQRAPWAVLGYSKDLENLFNKQTSEFCAAVEARKQELRSRGIAA